MNFFSTQYMLAVLYSLISPSNFLLDKFFTKEQTFETEQIFFDKISKKRRLAPFVSPIVEGQIMESQRREVDSFSPAYLKPKTKINPNQALKRAVGESAATPLKAIDRIALAIAVELQDHIDQIKLRLETMAAEILRTGKVTITGEKYPTKIVDFGRDAALTVTLTSTARWGQSAAKPLKNLKDWAALILKKSGAGVRDVIMDVDAWSEFSIDAEVEKKLALFNGNSTLVTDGVFVDGGVFMGRIDGFNIWVYSALGENDEPIFPSGTVVMASPDALQGVRAFGAIQDEEAGLQALAYSPKSWTVQDPPSRLIMTQSAPLLVPERVNASFCATVL
jgi:hypothetical protein